MSVAAQTAAACMEQHHWKRGAEVMHSVGANAGKAITAMGANSLAEAAESLYIGDVAHEASYEVTTNTLSMIKRSLS